MRVDSSVISEKAGRTGDFFSVDGDCENMAPATSSTGLPESSSSDRRVPLKTILQNFLNHVESLEARKQEGEDAYEKEFQVSNWNELVIFRGPGV